ncbi:MAG: hypothetical protein CBC73_05040 [Flavobacteriales bacterium TMED113]|nr:MAG: hypothetical protein CBC73_05040 [Flavobacteriales bacterium TMED113]
MPIDMNRVVVDEIFHDFIITVNLDHDMDSLTEDAYVLKYNYPSQSISNIGGWQSPVFGPQCSTEILNTIPQSISNLQKDCWELCNSITTGKFQKKLRKDHSGWWVNINEKHHYNAIHHHGRTDLIAVAFIKTPPNSGKMIVARNDGSTYSQLYDDFQYSVPSEAGKLYILPGHVWHYVAESFSDEDRISVSFNYYISV